MNKISFYHLATTALIRKRKKFKEFILEMFRVEKKKIKYLAIIFCKDEYLLTLNKRHLNHNYYTDTISFDLSSDSSELIGEIYISIDRVKENANYLKEKKENELLRVILHSCLHLCGYRDKLKKEQKEMCLKQEKYLSKWYVSRETIN